MLRVLSVSLLLSLTLPAQEPVPQPAVRVPAFPNSTCPIMGKKVSAALWIDTEMGRFWVCCRPCFKKVLADLPNAHKSAYPSVSDVANERCPVSGAEIGEQHEVVVLQGYRFRVASKQHAETARAESQLVLAKLLEPELEHVRNQTCPVTGEPVAKNAFAVIGTTIVQLSSPSCLAAVEADPRGVLDKARALAKQTPPKQGDPPPKPDQPKPNEPKPNTPPKREAGDRR